MQRNRKTFLTVEQLDARCCPSVTASVTHGTLAVFGQGKTDVTVTEKSAGDFHVAANGKSVGNFDGVSNGIELTLRNAPDRVVVNLGGNTLAGSLDVNLGNGQNALTIENGTTTGGLVITGGKGTDAIVLGSTGAEPVVIGGDTSVNSGLGGLDALTLKAGATLKGNLADLSSNLFTMAAGSSIEGNAKIFGGYASNKIVLGGTIGTPGSGDSLSILTGPDKDAVTFGNTLVINGSANVNLGAGDDTFTLKPGSTFQSATVNGGPGANTFIGDVGRVTASGFDNPKSGKHK